MVLPRSGMLRSLGATLVETSLTLLLPDTSYDTLQVLVPLLYGNKMTISVEAYSALSSVCAALDLHDWLQQEETEEENQVEEQSPEINRKEVVRARIETNNVENSAKNSNSRSDGLKCEICGKKVSNRYEAAPTLQRSAVRGRLSSTSAHNQTKYMDEAKPSTGNLPSVRPLPLFVAIARQAQILENFPSSLSNLRNGGNNFSGERRDRGSTLLP